MTASELNRQLLFYGYTEATDFLKNSPLNRYLYKQFLNIIPKYGIDIPMVQLFNEIYYQCVRVNYDGTPGVEIKQRYIAEEAEWLNSQSAADLVFSVVWALLRLKHDQTFQEDCFVEQITPYIYGCELSGVARSFYDELRYMGMDIPDSFPTMTCPLDGIPKFEIVQERTRSLDDMINASVEKKINLENQYFELREHREAWSTVTCNYSHSVIESYVRLYSSAEDQLELINRIQKTLPRNEIINLDGFFKDLISRIKTGNFDPDDTFTGRHAHKPYHDPDEQQDLEYSRALARASCEEGKDIVDDLKEERDRLKAQIEELQKSHEMELAKMEAQYKAEIDKIRKERNKLAHEPEARKEQVSANEPKELMLALTEIAAFVKERFSKSGANEICTLLYSKASEHDYFGEDTFKLIEGIIPAIIKRDKPQNNVDISQAGVVNINPQQAITQLKEEEK